MKPVAAEVKRAGGRKRFTGAADTFSAGHPRSRGSDSGHIQSDEMCHGSLSALCRDGTVALTLARSLAQTLSLPISMTCSYQGAGVAVVKFRRLQSVKRKMTSVQMYWTASPRVAQLEV